MKSQSLVLILGLALLSTNSLAQKSTLLFVKKKKSSFEQDIVQKLEVNISKSSKNIELIRKEMITSGKYKFVEYDSTQYQANDISKLSEKDLTGAWHHDTINTDQAWKLIKNPAEVIVAVCDSGLEQNHIDLRNVLP